MSEQTIPLIQPANSEMTLANWWDHILARWAVSRGGHRIAPGLYALGKPSADARVFVTGNYTLSFDALRAALKGEDGYILALDTQGINVWCAAGKGTFGTDELVRRIEETGLSQVVNRKVLILPQLGAPGVAAHEVKKRSGFKVEYGPVRAADLPEYLKTGEATAEMRRVRFGLIDRIVLIPVELTAALLVLLLVGGLLRSWAAATAILAGVAAFPILLPWLPTKDFSTKGFILGLLVAIPFAVMSFLRHAEWALWMRSLQALSVLLTMPPITAFLALNFTGSTTFTSRSGVRKEIFAYIPAMAWSFGAGLLLTVLSIFFFK